MPSSAIRSNLYVRVVWIVSIASRVPQLLHQTRWSVADHQRHRQCHVLSGCSFCTVVRGVGTGRLWCLCQIRDQMRKIDPTLWHPDHLTRLVRGYSLFRVNEGNSSWERRLTSGSAWLSASPISSLAQTTMRRAMNNGSSPAHSMRASQ